ncbi:acyltransferase family protein, partial [Labrys sp. KB_33_2]|uniref:acyltransferase family protein n=1 Tax=Labrys sp. KB_33_2 TaxID=3237479 RepID=UPI003F8E33C7
HWACMISTRLSNIDGLRAVAALAVFVQHAGGDVLRASSAAMALHPIFEAMTGTVDLGRFGVVLFFLISGFVVPFSLGGDKPLRRFVLSRFFRLYPCLWLALVALTLLSWSRGTPPDLATIAANMTMAPGLFGKAWLSNIYWTLFIELLFYVSTVILFALGWLFRWRAVLAAGLLLVASTLVPIMLRQHFGLNLPAQYVGIHLSILFSGLLLRMALVEREGGAAWAALILLTVQILSVALIGAFSVARNDGFAGTSVGPVLAAYILAMAVFILAARSGRPHSAILAFIGMISYAIYLFHWIVGELVYAIWPLTGSWTDLRMITMSLVLTIALSWAIYEMLEKPMMRLGKRLSRRGSAPVLDEPARIDMGQRLG